MFPAAACALASPKSTTLTRPSAVSSTFSGLTSRCTIPAWCAADSPASIGSMTSSASLQGSQPRSRSRLRSVRPGTYSIDRYRNCPSEPWSKTCTMFGWDSSRDRLGLADEPGHEVGVPRELRVHHLKRHLPVEPGVGGEVHGGHAAVRDAGADVVPAVKHPADKRVREGRFHHGRFYVQRRTRRLVIALSVRRLRGLPPLAAVGCAGHELSRTYRRDWCRSRRIPHGGRAQAPWLLRAAHADRRGGPAAV